MKIPIKVYKNIDQVTINVELVSNIRLPDGHYEMSVETIPTFQDNEIFYRGYLFYDLNV